VPDITVRGAPEATPDITHGDPPLGTGEHLAHGLGSLDPVGDISVETLNALGIDDNINNIPEGDRDNLRLVGDYVAELAKGRGLALTHRAFNRVLADVKLEMEIDPEAEPSVVLDRIGGLVKSWNDIIFIKDPKERRALFMKLGKQLDSKSMDKVVYEEMNRRKIWKGE